MATLTPVRATVNLLDLRAGQTALVDERQPYIAALLDNHLLEPLEEGPDTGTAERDT